MRACRGREGVNENLNRQQYHTQTNKVCAKEAQQNGGEQEQANFIMNYSRPMGGTKTEKRTTDLYYCTVFLFLFFGTLFTQREVDKSSSLLMWNILIILFCYPTHFFFFFLLFFRHLFCVFLFCFYSVILLVLAIIAK